MWCQLQTGWRYLHTTGVLAEACICGKRHLFGLIEDMILPQGFRLATGLTDLA